MRIPIKGITKGSNTNVSQLMHPVDQPYMMLGCNNTWKIGKLTKDTGYSIVDAAMEANKSVLGLYHFRQEPGTEKMLATIDDATSDDTQLFYRANGAGAWTEIAGAETAWANFAGIKVRMESFIGYCFFVGYGATDGFLPVASLTGTTFSTTTNVTNMPKAKYITKYKGQIFIANCQIGATNYPFRIYKSSYPTAGAITWTVATDFLDVDYSDELTGITTAWGKMIAFTPFKMWVYDGSTWDDPYEYGCTSADTIKKHGPYMIWCNNDGVWASTGGQPQNISGEIYDFYKAADKTALFAEIVDEQYWLYLGNVTVNGVGYTNLCAIFDISKSIWWFRELAHTAKSFARYTNSTGDRRLYIGDSTGKVFNKGKYVDATVLKTDDGYAISSSFELAPITLDSLNKFKKLNGIISYSDRALGLKLKVRAVSKTGRILSPYKPIGELTQFVNSFSIDVEDGVILQIAGSEYGSNEYWSFMGYDLDIDVTSNVPR